MHTSKTEMMQMNYKRGAENNDQISWASLTPFPSGKERRQKTNITDNVHAT